MATTIAQPALSRPANAATDRFQSWCGQSGRRYITSVFPIDSDAPAEGLPDFGPAVLFAVARHGGRRVIVGLRAVETDHDWSQAITSLHGTAVEWHVHLMARHRAARSAVVADFAPARSVVNAA